MKLDNEIPEPLLFNPLKHHLGYIKDFTEYYTMLESFDRSEFLRILGHIGGSVMDIYSGALTCSDIYLQALEILKTGDLLSKEKFIAWTGSRPKDFRTIELSDGSKWVMKYYNHEHHWAHIFPARMSPHSFRVKANTLKSAILYQVFVGNDFVSEEALNRARAIGRLSPVKDVFDADAITEMIELLRS